MAFQDYASAYWAEHVKAVAVSCAGLFSRRPDLVSEFDAALDGFISAYRPGLHHEPHPDFARLGYGVALGPMMGSAADSGTAAGMTGFAFFPKLKLLLGHLYTQSKRPGAQDRLLVPQLQTALRSNRQVLEKLFESLPETTTMTTMTSPASAPPSTAAAASGRIPTGAISPPSSTQSQPSSRQHFMSGSRPAPHLPPYPVSPLPPARLPPPVAAHAIPARAQPCQQSWHRVLLTRRSPGPQPRHPHPGILRDTAVEMRPPHLPSVLLRVLVSVATQRPSGPAREAVPVHR